MRTRVHPVPHYIMLSFIQQDRFPILVNASGICMENLRGAAWHADRWHGAIFYSSDWESAMVPFCRLSFPEEPTFSAKDVGMQQELWDSLSGSVFARHTEDIE